MDGAPWLAIIDACARANGGTRDDLFSRRRAYMHARLLCYWLLRRRLHLSYPQIAALMGWRDHSTIIYGNRRWEALRAQNPACADLERRACAELDRVPA